MCPKSLGQVTFLYLMGMNINTLTMFALILVIGSVVDDAICVVECYMRLIQEEKSLPLMLVGLTAKTLILMVEYSKQLQDQDMSIQDAAISGMKVWFRALMMTAFSFVIGVLLMVVATGAGAGSRNSIGVTTFFGMLVATVIGMMLIPGLYVIKRSVSEKAKHIFGRQ